MVLANGQTPDPAEIRNVVENGRGKQMPAWKKRLTSDEITAVVEYVRALEASAQSR
jgi:mono/diheme cytochrome c family protein